MKRLFLGIFFFLPQHSFAYIPPSKMILERTAENSGQSSYSIENEIQFQNGLEPLVLRESWVFDNERGMRLTVSGTKEFKDSIKIQFVYSGDQRFSLKAGLREKQSLSEDLEEKFFHFHSAEEIAAHLVGWGVAPVNFLNRRSVNKKNEYEPEPWVRLARTGGVIAYAFGKPSPENQAEANPGLWIEQDQFFIRKIRLPSLAEVSAENYTLFARGLNYPKNRTIQWGQNSATIRVLSVSAKDSKWAKQRTNPGNLDTTQKLDGLAQQPAKAIIEEFYSRFR